MTLNKKKMVREIGLRTRLKNRDVQTLVEALIDLWIEELVDGGRIELQNFIVLEVQPHRFNVRLCLRTSKALRHRLRSTLLIDGEKVNSYLDQSNQQNE
jgi:nucleoid DNA-binding protein